ncbi:MAG: D-alanine--D-alanine ligase, partial [Desulfovibrio sp.]|nr:D-alanine--D-alanine ligase [Desulfovibrio sp.]
MRILLIAGGWSTERSVSLSGAKAMVKAIEQLGHSVTLYDLLDLTHLPSMVEKHDLALINLHGEPGEDGLVQAMLDRLGCPYQGSGPGASFLALHKSVTKQLVQRSGILTPKWC